MQNQTMRFNKQCMPLLVALIVLASCSDDIERQDSADSGETMRVAQTKPDQGQSSIGNDSTISWFTGSVEEAFSHAKAQSRPLYLYWGAIWCPPCQEIKSTVFKSNRFIAQSKLFVPVYLDGDTRLAQSWGEHFGVKGYPTMIVFNPDGIEITRIPGGIDVSRYTRVLELSLNSMRPTAMLIDLSINNPGDLQSSDFTQLAYYSWQQDHTALPEDQGSDLFKSLSEMAQDRNPEASARLYMHYIATLAEERKTKTVAEESGKVSANQHSAMPEAIDRIKLILASDDLTLACWDYLTYYSESLVSLISTAGKTRDQLIQLWQEKTLSLHRDKLLSTAEQLAAWFPVLELFWLTSPEGKLAAELILKLKADVAHADKITRSPYARQSVVNQINHLLQTAKLYDEAEKLLLAELKTSNSAYYFMSSLAGLSEKQERFDAAIKWRKQAYESSQGDATRFQWGATYIRSIIRMKPDQHDLIVATSIKLFDVLESSDEVFAGRNFQVLTSLNGKLKEWQAEQDNQESLAPFHKKLEQLCAEQEIASQESKNCTRLLEGLVISAA